MAPTENPSRAATRDLFGHPIGLSYLFGTELWERFSYYGMRAILVLYLVNFLLLPGQAEHIIGYATLRDLTTAIAGHPLGVQPMSSIIFGLYAGFVSLTPFFGGIVADRWLGQRRSVIIGGLTMAAAEFTLMVPRLLFVGLLLLIIGNGFFKPNLSTQVGSLYAPGDRRIDRAYMAFYVGINIGSFFSPFICGTLGESVGYHWGFMAAGIGMLIGLAIYVAASRKLPPDRVMALKMGRQDDPPLSKSDWKAVGALIALTIPSALFWAAYEQQGNTITLWAQNFTDRTLLPGIVDVQIPVTWFQSFNPLMIFAFMPMIMRLWDRQASRNAEPSTTIKMAVGCFLLALGYAIMACAAFGSGQAGNASWLWLLAFFAVVTLGELYLSPIGLALVVRVAPPQILSMMMGLWFITAFAGNLLQGILASRWSGMDKVSFFLMIAAVAFLAGIIIWLMDRPLRKIIGRPVRPDPELVLLTPSE